MEEDYRGEHGAPDKESGSPLHDLTGTYPEDFYSSKCAQYYGDGRNTDSQLALYIQSFRNRPNRPVKIYRAVPRTLTNEEKILELENQKRYILKYGKVPPGVMVQNSSKYYELISQKIEKLKNTPEAEIKDIKTINPGDWVTVFRPYAVEHGKSALNGEYRILSKTVKAKEVYTNGDSFYEWGWDPS